MNMNTLNSVIEKLASIGLKKDECEDAVFTKKTLTLFPFYIAIPALCWSGIYFYFKEMLAASIPLIYLFFSAVSLLILYKTKRFFLFEMTQLLLILLLPFAFTWVYDDIHGGSYSFVWGFYAPITAIMYNKNFKLALVLFAIFSLLMFFTLTDDIFFFGYSSSELVSPKLIEIFSFLNFFIAFSGIFLLIYMYKVNITKISIELRKEKQRLYRLTNDLKFANKKLEKLATCDIVTNLPNRYYFEEIIEQMIAEAKENKKNFIVMFLDLDGFKNINDTLGHDAGDFVLKTVGEKLRSKLRSNDIVARIGGDEFAVAVNDVKERSIAQKIAKNLIEAVNQPCKYKEKTCQVGVSIGIVIIDDTVKTAHEVLKKADMAMYVVKKSGKNNFYFYEEEE